MIHKRPDFNIGDKVTYSRTFLRNVGIYNYEIANHLGEVTAVDSVLWVCVLWADGDEGLVHYKNLTLKSRIHLEAI